MAHNSTEAELRQHIVDLTKVLAQAGRWVGKGIEQGAYVNCVGENSARLCLDYIDKLLEKRV